MPLDSAGRRATRLAKIGIDLVWWVALVFGGLLAILFVLSPVLLTNGSGLNKVGVEVSISNSGIRTTPLSSADAGLASDIVLEDRNPTRRLEFRTTQWRWFLMINWAILPAIATLLFGTNLLRSFLADVLEARVFTATNATRLSNFGWLVIAMGIAEPLLNRWRSWMVLSRLEPTGPALVPAQLDWNTGSLTLGVLLLVLASAWRYGAELQQERDLTV